MKPQKTQQTTLERDAAIAAASVIMEELAPHAPNGIATAIHARLAEIIEAAIASVERVRWQKQTEPSRN